jgi:hypothetical protein
VPPNSRNAGKKELSQRAEHPVEYSPEQSSGMMGERRDCSMGVLLMAWTRAIGRPR